jgi:hypothetical protein
MNKNYKLLYPLIFDSDDIMDKIMKFTGNLKNYTINSGNIKGKINSIENCNEDIILNITTDKKIKSDEIHLILEFNKNEISALKFFIID